MKVSEFKIANYRAFNEKQQILVFKPGLNIIVGENNVGKSTILNAIDILAGGESVATKDFHKGESLREVRVEALFELNKSETETMIGKPYTDSTHDYMRVRELKRLFKIVRASFSTRYGISIDLDSLRFFSDRVTLGKRIREAVGSLKWNKLLEEYFSNEKPLTLSQIIRNHIEKSKSRTSSINRNLPNLFRSLLTKKFHVFAEIRQNPRGENVDVLESYDGRQVADVLFKLKNGSITQRKRWRLIQENFREFFPNLALEVVRETKESSPEISIEKTSINFEVPIKNVGAGIGEIVILITHLIASKDNIFGLEMPELHFHPHSQRLLKKFLDRYSVHNQFIITSHSPLFIDENDLESLILVKETRGVTSIIQLPKNFLAPLEKFRVARMLDPHKKEIFFSRKVLLVEGETEVGAFPIFSVYLRKDFDQLGISVAKSGKHFALLTKLLKEYRIPFLVVCDKDALMQIYKAVKSDGKKKIEARTSAVFYNLWRARMIKKKDLRLLEKLESKIENGEYMEDVFGQLRKISLGYNVYVLSSDFENVLESDPKMRRIFEEARKISDSKVIVGRYVAEKIKRAKLQLPKEFSEIIQKIVAMH